jgi:hypothetical protein
MGGGVPARPDRRQSWQPEHRRGKQITCAMLGTMTEDHHELPTPRTALAARYVRVLVFCRSCRHQHDADLQALVDQGRGDVPLVHLRRCSQCQTGNTDFVVTSQDALEKG